jgi:hypothetical protein
VPETKKILKRFDKTVKQAQDVDGGMDMTNGADQAANVNDLGGGGGSSWNRGDDHYGCRVHNSGCGT